MEYGKFFYLTLGKIGHIKVGNVLLHVSLR